MSLQDSGQYYHEVLKRIPPRDLPAFEDAAMQERETSPDDRIARPREPAALLCWQSIDVAAQGVDEQRLRKLGEHGFAADPARHGFLDEVQDGGFQPVPGRIAPHVDLEDRRKSVEDRAAEVRVARHVPAHEFRDDSPAAGTQRTQVARLDLRVIP